MILHIWGGVTWGQHEAKTGVKPQSQGPDDMSMMRLHSMHHVCR